MSTNKSSQFQTLIHERHSTRSAYELNHPISKQDLVKILDAGRWAPTAHNMQNYEVIVVDDKKLLESISKIESPPSEAFIRENYPLLSFSKEELQKKKVGILGTMFPPEWCDPEKFSQAFKTQERSRVGRFIETSPILVVIVFDPSKRAPASEGDFLGVMSLGCVLENMWLMAQSLGISLHIVSSLSNNEVENQVKKILGIPSYLKIGISFRLGYTSDRNSDYLRVRRNIEEFSHYNNFQTKFV